MGLGSDIGGSIRMPCFFNGIFGHKPTRGVVSNHGEWPVASKTHETYLGTGPMCKFATDLLPMMRVLARCDLKLDEKVNLRQLRVYYMEDDGGSPHISPVDAEIKQSMRKVVDYLAQAHGLKPQKVLNNLPSFLVTLKCLPVDRTIKIEKGHPDLAGKNEHRRDTKVLRTVGKL